MLVRTIFNFPTVLLDSLFFGCHINDDNIEGCIFNFKYHINQSKPSSHPKQESIQAYKNLTYLIIHP